MRCGSDCGLSLEIPSFAKCFRMMAGTTGLEPATSAVTGQRSNQLSYVPKLLAATWLYVT